MKQTKIKVYEIWWGDCFDHRQGVGTYRGLVQAATPEEAIATAEKIEPSMPPQDDIPGMPGWGWDRKDAYYVAYPADADDGMSMEMMIQDRDSSPLS